MIEGIIGGLGGFILVFGIWILIGCPCAGDRVSDGPHVDIIGYLKSKFKKKTAKRQQEKELQ